MFELSLKNGKKFICKENSNIIDAAKDAGIVLEHSCLTARCRSCIAKIGGGQVENINEDLILSKEEKESGYVLLCNVKPLSNLHIAIEDLGDINLSKPRTLPCKVYSKELLSNEIIKIVLRLPPNSKFTFLPGQYVNLIKANISRSYSISNAPQEEGNLEFLIKRYENGLMSNYWFSEVKENDLLRLQGPLGTFFYRKSEVDTIVFLATGTGIAPIKAILEGFEADYLEIEKKEIFVIWGNRNIQDFFWEPNDSILNRIKFIKVLSGSETSWDGEKGHVQNVLMKQNIDLINTQVYACGSNRMIISAKELLMKNNLEENNFYSDAFVSSN